MDIAQIAIDPPPSVKRAIVEKSVQNHPYTILTPPGNVGKKCPKPSWQALTPPPPYRQCPYGNNTFQKGASIREALKNLFFKNNS